MVYMKKNNWNVPIRKKICPKKIAQSERFLLLRFKFYDAFATVVAFAGVITVF